MLCSKPFAVGLFQHRNEKSQAIETSRRYTVNMRDKPRNEILGRAWLHVTAHQATVVAAISIYTPTWLMSHRKMNAFECLSYHVCGIRFAAAEFGTSQVGLAGCGMQQARLY
jgi:hypothetical protein